MAAGVYILIGSNGGKSEAVSVPKEHKDSSGSSRPDVTKAATPVPSPAGSHAEQGIADKPEENVTTDVLFSKSNDLDGDGDSEKVEIKKAAAVNENGDMEVEGKLYITDGNKTEEVPITKQNEGVMGLVSEVELQDLDGDGSKDVFAIIPSEGNPLVANYPYIYSYKSGKSLLMDNSWVSSGIGSFTEGFVFKYEGGGKLHIENAKYGFSARMDMRDDGNFSDSEADNKLYERAWVDSTPVYISEASKVSISKNKSGETEIKMPLPIFGQAVVDIIGEVNLFFKVDGDFTPVLKRFEVFDYNNGDISDKKKIGEASVK